MGQVMEDGIWVGGHVLIDLLRCILGRVITRGEVIPCLGFAFTYSCKDNHNEPERGNGGQGQQSVETGLWGPEGSPNLLGSSHRKTLHSTHAHRAGPAAASPENPGRGGVWL